MSTRTTRSRGRRTRGGARSRRPRSMSHLRYGRYSRIAGTGRSGSTGQASAALSRVPSDSGIQLSMTRICVGEVSPHRGLRQVRVHAGTSVADVLPGHSAGSTSGSSARRRSRRPTAGSRPEPPQLGDRVGVASIRRSTSGNARVERNEQDGRTRSPARRRPRPRPRARDEPLGQLAGRPPEGRRPSRRRRPGERARCRSRRSSSVPSPRRRHDLRARTRLRRPRPHRSTASCRQRAMRGGGDRARRSPRPRRSRSGSSSSPPGPSRGSVRCWVRTAPTPASTCPTRAPTAMSAVAAQAPSGPVRSQRATSAKVTPARPAAGAARPRRRPDPSWKRDAVSAPVAGRARRSGGRRSPVSTARCAAGPTKETSVTRPEMPISPAWAAVRLSARTCSGRTIATASSPTARPETPVTGHVPSCPRSDRDSGRRRAARRHGREGGSRRRRSRRRRACSGRA